MTAEEKAKLEAAVSNLAALDFYVTVSVSSMHADLDKAEMQIEISGKRLATWRAGEFLDDVRLVRDAMMLILDRDEEEAADAGERGDSMEEQAEEVTIE